MYFQLSVQRYVPWRYHLLCVEITEQIWHNRTKIQTGRSFGQFLVTRDQGKFGCLAADFLTLPISLCHPSSSSLFPPSSFSQTLPCLWKIRLNHWASSLNFFNSSPHGRWSWLKESGRVERWGRWLSPRVLVNLVWESISNLFIVHKYFISFPSLPVMRAVQVCESR